MGIRVISKVWSWAARGGGTATPSSGMSSSSTELDINGAEEFGGKSVLKAASFDPP
jgi:hypothetical protein